MFFENTVKIDKYHIPSLEIMFQQLKIENSNKIFKIFKNIDLSNLTHENKVLLLDALSKCYFDLDEIELAFNFVLIKPICIKKKNQFSMKDQETLFDNIKSFRI